MTDNRLAIQGAAPAFSDGPPSWPVANEQISSAIQSAIDSGNWGKYDSVIGENLMELLKKQFAVEHVMPCSSGTIAVELALRGVGVKANNEVLLAAYDFPGNFRAIEAIGARPVLIDVADDGWLMDLEKIDSAVSETTRAILVSHLHGHVVNMPKLRLLAERYNIAVVEDVCQAPGGLLSGQPLGSFGDVGVLSFGGSKLLSAGRGGALITSNASILQRAKIFANRGNDAFPLSQLQAAALIPQVESLNQIADLRHRNAILLQKLLASAGCLLPTFETAERVAPFKIPLLVSSELRKPFIECLKAEGVTVGEGFRGFAGRTERRCRKPMDLSNSKRAASETVILHHPVLLESEEYIKKLALTIAKVFKFVCEQVK